MSWRPSTPSPRNADSPTRSWLHCWRPRTDRRAIPRRHGQRTLSGVSAGARFDSAPQEPAVELLTGLIPDDLRGWFESKDGERVREPGILEAFNLSPEDAEALIMRARVVMGWVEAPPEPEYEEGDYAKEGEFAEEGEASAEGEAEEA